MIVRDRPNAFRLFFILRGAIVQRVWPQILGVAALSALIVGLRRWHPELIPDASQVPFSLIGISLSIFLSFRNGACYDRWWEARKLWGQMIQTARDFIRHTMILDPGDGSIAPERRRILELVIGFAHCAVRQLRHQPRAPEDPAGQNPTDGALSRIGAEIAAAQRAGRLSDIQAYLLQESLLRLSYCYVACERLSNTPLPFAYMLLLHRTAYIFCFVLPFGFADSLGWLTPLASALVAYTFFGLDALSEELEEPFGEAPNDLPIAAYATVMEISLREALGETDLPPMPQPKNFLLS